MVVNFLSLIVLFHFSTIVEFRHNEFLKNTALKLKEATLSRTHWRDWCCLIESNYFTFTSYFFLFRLPMSVLKCLPS